MSRSKSKRARSQVAHTSTKPAALATPQSVAGTSFAAASCPITSPDDEPILLPPQLSDDPDGRSVVVRSAADYAHRRVEWLWHKRIPIGKVTLLCGDPGLGKSLVALDIAARVTRGLAFPGSQPPALPGVLGEPAIDPSPNKVEQPNSVSVDAPNTSANPRQSRGLMGEHVVGSPGMTGKHAHGSVLVLTNEDNIADTVRPRFEALGGDLRRIFFAESITNLRDDFDQLVATLDRLPSCRLIIIDPVNSFVGPSDSHFATVVGRVLKPLSKLAEQRGIAIVAVTHLRKSEGATIQRAAGTMGFVGFARTVWTIARDRRNPNRRLVVPVKNNLAATDNALAYQIAVDEQLDVPFVQWEPQPLDTAAIDEATLSNKKSPGPEAEEREAAAEWLTLALSQEPCMAGELIREGKDMGFHPRTLRRGLKAIGGKTTRLGPIIGWQWSLSKKETSPKKETTPPNVPADDWQPKPAQPTWPPNDSATAGPQTAPASSTPQNQSAAKPAPESRRPQPPNPHPEGSPKKPVPFETTCPLPENTHVPIPDTRNLTPAPPPPGTSSTIDDDLLDSSMRYLDARMARRRKPAPDPTPTATPSTTPQHHPLNGHSLIGQIAALAQRDQARPAVPALGATGSASACGGLPATGLRDGERIADLSRQKSGDNWTRPALACT